MKSFFTNENHPLVLLSKTVKDQGFSSTSKLTISLLPFCVLREDTRLWGEKQRTFTPFTGGSLRLELLLASLLSQMDAARA